MQANITYEKRESKRVMIPNSIIKPIQNLTIVKDENEIEFSRGAEVAIDNIYKKTPLGILIKKYKMKEKDVLFCIKHFGVYVIKYINSFEKVRIIESIWKSSVSFEIKLAIIIDYFDRKLDMEDISKNYGFPDTSINSLIRSYMHDEKQSGQGVILSYQRQHDKKESAVAENSEQQNDSEIMKNKQEFKSNDISDKKIKRKEKYLAILNEHNSNGVSFVKLAKRHGVLYQTLMNWKKKYIGVIEKVDTYKGPSKEIKKEDVILILKEHQERKISIRKLALKYNFDYQTFMNKKNRYQQEILTKKIASKNGIIKNDRNTNLMQDDKNKNKELELEITRLKNINEFLVSFIKK